MSNDSSGIGGTGTTLNQALSAVSAFAAFLPWFDAVNKVIDEIYGIYDAAEYNKKTCRVLVDRVDNVATAVRKLNRRKDEEEDKFHSQDYIKTFIKLHRILKNIKEFVNNVSQLKGLSKFFYAKDIKAKCLSLMEELETTCNELQFGIIISMEDRALEQKGLADDVNNMTEFLKTIEGGVIDTKNQLKENTGVLETVRDQNDEIKIALNVIFEEVIEIKKKMYKREISLVAPQIEMSRLREDNERTSLTENRKIFKRLYGGTEVACKRISIPNDDEKWKMTKNRFAILNRLQQSDKIIKFYGFAKYDNDVINGYSKIIRAAWAQEASERPSINVFNTELYQLNKLNNDIEDFNNNNEEPVSEETSDDEYDDLYVKEFLAYLNKAVINGNPSALFNYGDLFLNGKLGIKKDEEKGIRYLKMAAVKGQPKALEELKKRNISL
ncbi:25098_t:CDS:2 [Cetraspora pellucida]|uniref:25098_t:CDS:1 n=1 Tax=Cetraspora pellucida TaxID=1433469 RepID=A0A9N9FBW0_9GLOM|nr:25098_t:CDS:2 [Cetraspora pellucida]